MLAESRSFDQFRDDEMSLTELTEFVDCEDVRMVQGRSRACFSLKTADAFVISRVMREQNLQRNPATKSSILGEINFAHATGTESFSDAVATKLASND